MGKTVFLFSSFFKSLFVGLHIKGVIVINTVIQAQYFLVKTSY